MAKNYYSEEEIKKIQESTSILDYFNYLENKGLVKFKNKHRNDFYFEGENAKYAVSEKGFYDFKAGTDKNGGGILKAVMDVEKKSWKEALDFLADFPNLQFEKSEKYKFAKAETNTISNKIEITKIHTPNNEKLLEYFNQRGISNEILKSHTQQIHYKNTETNKSYFGIGLENRSKGWDIRNPMIKMKLGKGDISIIDGKRKDEMIVVEGMTDALSFLQLQKDAGQENSRKIVVLNSVVNTQKFLESEKNFNGKMHLLLDGDDAGDSTTEMIQKAFKIKANVIDARKRYGIGKEHKDLNDYLKNKIQKQSLLITDLNYKPLQNRENIRNFEKLETKENERNNQQSREISTFEQMGRGENQSNDRESDSKSQSKYEKHNRSSETIHSNNAGNGSANAEQLNLFNSRRGNTSGARESEEKRRDNEETQGVGNRALGLRDERTRRILGESSSSQNRRRERERDLEGELLPRSTIVEKYNDLLSVLKNEKVQNTDIENLLELVAYVDDKQQVQLFDDITIDDDLLNVINQYKTGGVTKQGRGVLDEYYTEKDLVDEVKRIIGNKFLNHQQINVLEPSVGTGNFLSAINSNAKVKNIDTFEINPVSAKIAKILNPNINVNLRSFETEFIDEYGIKKDVTEKYDLVVGNPPYGKHRGFYLGIGEEPNIKSYEDYFVKRSLDVMKDGGVLAMVLPSGWLNRQNKLENAELNLAYRLPNGVFKGTDVGTDIIILTKNSKMQSQDISNYFDKHPAHVLGETTQKTNRFGRNEDYIKGDMFSAKSLLSSLPTLDNIERIKEFIPEEKNIELSHDNNVQNETASQSNKDLKKELHEGIGQLLIEIRGKKFQTPLIKKQEKRWKDELLKLDNYTHKEIISLKDKLDKNLNKFVGKEKGGEQISIQDTPELQKDVIKYHFQKEDAIVSAGKNKHLTPALLSSFKDTSYDGELQDYEKHINFANYHNGKWVHDFYYAEGNIYQKLKDLDRDFTEGNIDEERYNKQKGLLTKVLPEPKNLNEIILAPNHEFVHKFIVGKEEKEFMTISGRSYGGINPRPIYKQEIKEVEVSLSEKFKSFLEDLDYRAFQGSSRWEVREYVDNRNVTGSDKERNALIRERRKLVGNDLFERFLKDEIDDDLKNRIVKEFNENYNNIHVPDYSQFPLFSKINENFKGKPLQLTEVQKAGVGRLTTKGVGLLAHEVGFGKTLSGVMAMHEAMQRGNAKRPLIVVPNDAILKQWVETIYELIPDAKVNVLGNLGKKVDLSNFDNYDGEISLVTYSGFNNIGFSAEITNELAEKFEYITSSEIKSLKNSERDEQIELAKQEETKGKMLRGKVYDWEDFGFDHLTFDEAHNANHIVSKVKIEDRRIASDFRNQNQRTSALGINTWMAAQYIQKNYDGRNVTLLSATPFTNKPLEYYSVLSLMANDRLKETGFLNVNTFFETFMEADNEMEITATNEVKNKMNVRRFKNNALFQRLLSEFIDIKGEDDNPQLVRPNKINKEYKIEQNDATKTAYEKLSSEYDESEKGAILTHILNARLIAISPLLSPDAEKNDFTAKEFVESSEKLKTTMDLIAQNKMDKPEAGQIIYSELAVAQFPLLKDYLVEELGYNKDEVEIITGSVSKDKRLKIQEKFNNGDIKVVIGSEAIQEGMNLQENTTDMYLLSLPYNFTSLRQTEGRAWRQGNKWENVRMNFMLTNDSIDVFMLQKLQAKQARYQEAMRNGADILDVSDVDTQELKTALITNPETRAEIEIKILEKRYQYEKEKLNTDIAFFEKKFNNYKEGKISSKDLAASGIDVKEIDSRIRLNKEKIEKIEQTLSNLPEQKDALIERFKVEKTKDLENKKSIDFAQERKLENKTFFKLREDKDLKPIEIDNNQSQDEFSKKSMRR